MNNQPKVRTRNLKLGLIIPSEEKNKLAKSLAYNSLKDKLLISSNAANVVTNNSESESDDE